MSRKLYKVTLQTEIAVLADGIQDAEQRALMEAQDLDFDAVAHLVSEEDPPPDGWDSDSLVYGTFEDVTWAEAKERNKA